jgi:hypothetical protein
MPKVKTIQTNFSAGELSPKAMGRVDIARYGNAAEILENVISRTLGGAEKRPGTEYLNEVKDSAQRARLVPYIINREQSYMLEFGDEYMRVHKMDGTPVMDGGSPYEITTPYDIDMVQDFDFCQSENAMFVFHQEVPIARVRFFSEDYWDCSPAPFTTIPFDEVGEYFNLDLTLADNTVGTGKNASVPSDTFLVGDVGRAILYKAGIYIITAVTDAKNIVGEIKVPFETSVLPANEWNLDSSPQLVCDPSGSDTTALGTRIDLRLKNIAGSAAAGFRPTDVGKFVRINGGLIKIDQYVDGTRALGPLKIKMTSGVAVGALAWSIESSIWSDKFGYPEAGTTHQQRLVVGGTKRNPQTVFGSRTGELLDFMLGTADNEAFSFTIDTSQNKVGPLSYIVSMRDIVLLTDGGEFAIRSGIEKPVTPTNVRITAETNNGSKRIKPIVVGKEALFPNRTGKKLRAISYAYDNDGYNSPDISTLGEHLTQYGIAAMALQQEPDPIVWISLNNGRLISVTFDRELDIIAWNRHPTDGAVESIASMPTGDTEQLWAVVRRKLGDGTIKRYIERFQPDWYPVYDQPLPDPDEFPVADDPFNWGFQLDCALSQDDAVGKTVWDGFDHLEGREIRVLADGVDMAEFTVTDGEITLPRAAKRILGGLFFAPRIIPLRPEIQSGEGTSQSSAMSTNEVTLRFNNTIGALVNGSEVMPGRIIGPDQLDRAPELFSGDVSESVVGWAKGESEIEISQDAPFPFHLLAIIRSLTVNGG